MASIPFARATRPGLRSPALSRAASTRPAMLGASASLASLFAKLNTVAHELAYNTGTIGTAAAIACLGAP